MKIQLAAILAATLFAVESSSVRATIIIPTNFGNGADAEVREEAGTANRGTNMELATRKSSDGSVSMAGNNSAFYLRFDIRGLTTTQVTANPGAALLIRTRQGSNIQPNDVHAPHPISMSDVYNQFNVRGLGQALSEPWEENLITYNSAPGITPDSNTGTEDFNAADFTLLGSFQLPNIDGQNWMAAGTPIQFTSPALYSFVQSAVGAGRTSVTMVVNMALPALRPANGGTTPNSFLAQNYVFLSKDNPFVQNDPNWDADTADPNNPLGSPWSNADNRFGAFSPQLVLGSLSGDFNHNGAVDAADYVVWRKTDGTQDGYDTWRAHFGDAIGGGSIAIANAVTPEPGTRVLLTIGLLAMFYRRRPVVA